MKSAFANCHPAIHFLWFCAVIILSMFLLHPAFLALSAMGSATYALMLGGRKNGKFILTFLLPMIGLVTIGNLLISHQGVTILGYLGNNPITKEAILYGLISGVMFASIFLWFSCYNAIMTSDKLVYLFGRIIPSISLVFSMLMRSIPRFKSRMKQISQAQKAIGRKGTGSLMQRGKQGLKILSIMTTWALENSVDTADSMKSRGYGLKGRTAFSIYRFDVRDKILLLWLLLLLAVVITGSILGNCLARYYPYMELAGLTPGFFITCAAWALLCFLPVLFDTKEEIQWRRLQSKI